LYNSFRDYSTKWFLSITKEYVPHAAFAAMQNEKSCPKAAFLCLANTMDASHEQA